MRLAIRKTYKLFINGQFPRTESGRSYAVRAAEGGNVLANVCKGSRKDVRNAVVAARNAQASWAKSSAYLRGQILYRVAELCEARWRELAEELEQQGASPEAARSEVHAAIELWVYYAGFADKFQQVLGSVNPVSGPYYNFSAAEPVGVAGIIAPETPALAGLVARIAPAIAAGNTVVALASEAQPLSAVTLGEILATSDVPPGVVNIITGHKQELSSGLAAHMDVNLIDLTGAAPEARRELELEAAENVKRIVLGRPGADGAFTASLWALADFCEIKTVWHPLGY